jgi:hypothetical protein
VTVHTYIAGGVVELKRVEDNEVVGAGAPLDQAAGLSNPGRSLLFAAGAATIRSVVLLQLRQQMTSRRRVSVASSEPPHYGGWPTASCSSWAAVRHCFALGLPYIVLHCRLPSHVTSTSMNHLQACWAYISLGFF